MVGIGTMGTMGAFRHGFFFFLTALTRKGVGR
jgi:hypothetical protein